MNMKVVREGREGGQEVMRDTERKGEDQEELRSHLLLKNLLPLLRHLTGSSEKSLLDQVTLQWFQ